MDPCHNSRPFARRAFIIAAYRASADGVLRPIMPERCIHGATGDGPACRVRVHHWRSRKTGPEFPLLVAECQTHGVAFTLYPPGHVPYGRVSVAPVDREGQLLRIADGASGDRPTAWEPTIMGAAQDAAEGRAWPRSGDDWTDASGSWRTQGRRIRQAAEILGLTGLAECPLVGPLGVTTLGHRESIATFAEATGYRSRGAAVCPVVREIEVASRPQLDLILSAGLAAGRWGKPWRWDGASRRLRQVEARARSP
jgi:hypothetical protein